MAAFIRLNSGGPGQATAVGKGAGVDEGDANWVGEAAFRLAASASWLHSGGKGPPLLRTVSRNAAGLRPV